MAANLKPTWEIIMPCAALLGLGGTLVKFVNTNNSKHPVACPGLLHHCSSCKLCKSKEQRCKGSTWIVQWNILDDFSGEFSLNIFQHISFLKWLETSPLLLFYPMPVSSFRLLIFTLQWRRTSFQCSSNLVLLVPGNSSLWNNSFCLPTFWTKSTSSRKSFHKEKDRCSFLFV